MKRSPFKTMYSPREPTQSTYTPRPRDVAVFDGKASMSVPASKFEYIRDERFRTMCRDMACKACGAAGPTAGVTWSHSNQGKHGHAMGIKASDQFVAALCWACHLELDQGMRDTQAEKVALWDRAHARTVALAVKRGTWPAGVPVPEIDVPPWEAAA